jgi:hypothetical protein
MTVRSEVDAKGAPQCRSVGLFYVGAYDVSDRVHDCDFECTVSNEEDVGVHLLHRCDARRVLWGEGKCTHCRGPSHNCLHARSVYGHSSDEVSGDHSGILDGAAR